MTMTFTYTFKVWTQKEGTDGHDMKDWYQREVTLTKRVTDRMEERKGHKAGYAAHYFNKVRREQYGYHKSTITACDVVRIK